MSNCVGNFTDLRVRKKESFLILGSGTTVREYRHQIVKLINEKSLVVIGINNMTHIYKPDIHLWTNNGRLKKHGNCIAVNSTVILGNKIKKENIPSHVDYYTVDYVDGVFYNQFSIPQIKSGLIKGSFRQAGGLALYLAHLLGAENIYYAGVDGYSQPYKGNQHCYGEGCTDSSDMTAERKKDAIIYKCLKEIKKVVDFQIITPTIFTEFYNESIMAANS